MAKIKNGKKDALRNFENGISLFDRLKMKSLFGGISLLKKALLVDKKPEFSGTEMS